MNKMEKKILKKVSDNHLMTKEEIVNFLRKDGGEGGYEASLRKLLENDLIATIRPVGSTCFIITQKGTQILRDIEA